jgi:hypothetical protein
MARGSHLNAPIVLAMLLLALFATDIKAADFAAERCQMVDEIKQLTADSAAETGLSCRRLEHGSFCPGASVCLAPQAKWLTPG